MYGISILKIVAIANLTLFFSEKDVLFSEVFITYFSKKNGKVLFLFFKSQFVHFDSINPVECF